MDKDLRWKRDKRLLKDIRPSLAKVAFRLFRHTGKVNRYWARVLTASMIAESASRSQGRNRELLVTIAYRFLPKMDLITENDC